MKILKANDRGHVNHGWLDARHTFSFASYHNPEYMGHGALRVMNEDRVMPGKGFGTHSHKDMEILTYIISGSLEHKDNMGNGSVIKAGDFQRMSAGTGISHSEFNPSKTEETHLYQIWINPSEINLPTGYEERTSEKFTSVDGVARISSQSGLDNSMSIQQDAAVYFVDLEKDDSSSLKLQRQYSWVQVISGSILINEVELFAGDGAAFEGAQEITITASDISKALVFDLPK